MVYAVKMISVTVDEVEEDSDSIALTVSGENVSVWIASTSLAGADGLARAKSVGSGCFHIQSPSRYGIVRLTWSGIVSRQSQPIHHPRISNEAHLLVSTQKLTMTRTPVSSPIFPS